MEDLRCLQLWDVYSPLLTKTQREVADLYFNFDLSLAEIAEQRGCSRQSISDTLSKVRRQLEEYEERLHVARLLEERALEQTRLKERIAEWARERLSAAQAQELAALLGEPSGAGEPPLQGREKIV